MCIGTTMQRPTRNPPTTHAGHSVLTKSQVLDSMQTFFPNISAREVKALVGAGNLSTDKLRKLLLNPEAPLVGASLWESCR